MGLFLTIVIFLVILAALIVVHEFGHFIMAKLFGIRVDEFALGFPPRIFAFKKGETEYALNAIPFGGYVRIFGENPDDESLVGPDSGRSFVNKSKWIQAAVLIAGILFNVIFAWVLTIAGLSGGLPTPTDSYADTTVSQIHLALTDISDDSPAAKAGLQAGDTVVSLSVGSTILHGQALTPEAVSSLISDDNGQAVTISISDSNVIKTFSITPVAGIVPNKVAIGVTMGLLGTAHLSFFQAVSQGTELTWLELKAVVVGLYSFFAQIVVGHPDFSQVSGPVGIVTQVGDASRFGFFYLLSFTALISLNLAVINLIPFPALDGGRIFFVIIEAIKGSPIKPKIANTFNAVGFCILILLMLVITYQDITKLIVK